MANSNNHGRIWGVHQLILPILLTAIIGLATWVSQIAVASHYDRLTAADEHRIVANAHSYTDSQAKLLRQDLREIRQDLSHHQDLLLQILLEIKKTK